jgi:uncharacterized protein
MMNYRLEDIPPEGILVQGEQDESWLKSLFSDPEKLEFKFASPVSYEISIFRSHALVLVKGWLNFKISFSCSRCLEQFTLGFHPEFDISLSPAQFQNLPVEMELQREDLDMEFYSGKTIDLGSIIQSQMMLAIPFYPLCRKDCQGLCPHCGANKNYEICQCEERKLVNSKVLILKDFFKK